jgi:oligoendopeptidase F
VTVISKVTVTITEKDSIMPKSLPPRSQIDPKYTWNKESVFATPAAFEQEAGDIVASLPGLLSFQGHLAEGPAILADALDAMQKVILRAYRVFMYASFSSAVDTSDQAASAMVGKARSVFGRTAGTVSFINPELLAIGEKKLRKWLKDEPRLAIYEHFIDDLFRKQAHVRSAEVEELLGSLLDPFGGVGNAYDMLSNADLKFAPGKDADGNLLEVSQSTLSQALSMPDRTARQTAWESYMDRHLEFKNTLAATLGGSIKQFIFMTRTRKHNSSLEMSLFDNNIPAEVFYNLIETFKKNLPVWHRYFDIRRKALKQTEIAPYDMWAPLTAKKTGIPYEQAVELIAAGLEPMGKDYAETIRQGCLKERWVDVMPNQGKYNGAFSSGAPGTHPFIMMSFGENIFSLSTLAHELGHSMHSYLTWQNQPSIYGDYSLFVAEVASNFHQAMVRGHLFKVNREPEFEIEIIEEAMSNFFRYFFIMPTLARFELETHQRVERGEALTADSMIELMADLFAEAYGPGVTLDRARVGMTWGTFPHLYQDYYVYQYATGISGAHALSGRILRGEPGAVEDYLGFLKAGGSLYPLEALKKAGVDLTTPKAVEETFSVMAGYIDRLEKLVEHR